VNLADCIPKGDWQETAEEDIIDESGVQAIEEPEKEDEEEEET
jgi:hypothetical protein